MAAVAFGSPARASGYEHKCDWPGVKPNPAYTELKELVEVSRKWDMTAYAVELFLNDRATWDRVTTQGNAPGTGPGPQGLKLNGQHYELNKVNEPKVNSFRGVSLSHVNPCILSGEAPNREVPAYRPDRPSYPTLSELGYTEGDRTGFPQSGPTHDPLGDPWPWVSILPDRD